MADRKPLARFVVVLIDSPSLRLRSLASTSEGNWPMGAVIGEMLPLALGIAIFPVPIIGAILMLFSKSGGQHQRGVLVGWLLGIIVAIGTLTALAVTVQTGGAPSASSSWIKIGLGGLLLSLGLRQGAGRNAPHVTPKWMAAIDDFTPVNALGLGFLLSAINPKNLIMAADADANIGSDGLSVGVRSAPWPSSPRSPDRAWPFPSLPTWSQRKRCAGLWIGCESGWRPTTPR